jgi:hypothetical protein
VAFGGALLFSIPNLDAATNLPAFPRPGLSRTNILGAASKSNTTPATARAATNAANAATNRLAQTTQTNAPSGPPGTWQRVKSSRAFYPSVIGLAVCLGTLFLARAFVVRKPAQAVSTTTTSSKLAGRAAPKLASKGTIHSCNVLEVGAQARQLWQFEARGSSYVLSREHTALNGDPLPGRIVGKDWRTLFQKKLNVAWVPAENVFLRVVQLPWSDFNETLSMVELQLEKLSPMPVAQICWSFHSLPHPQEHQQTVIVMIVARSVVEEFLGQLEGQGYIADRLELPLLDQLQTTAITEDGAWIYPEAAAGKNSALVAWWYGGVLQNLDLLTLPADKPAEGLKEQLLQMAWAGELEGWLTSPPEWHLVADVAASQWEPPLRAGLEQPIEMISPRPTTELAALTARRSALSDPRANLLPAEFATRYQQQFHDRLWMRSLFALGAIYLLGVAIYMISLAYANFRTSSVEHYVASLGPTYTNAIQLRDRYNVLKERQELKYAGLDCWNTAARLLPENATLDNLNFADGKRLSLSGTAPSGDVQKLFEFERAMRNATSTDGQLLFDPTKGDSLQYHTRDQYATWSLNLELKRSEVQ